MISYRYRYRQSAAAVLEAKWQRPSAAGSQLVGSSERKTRIDSKGLSEPARWLRVRTPAGICLGSPPGPGWVVCYSLIWGRWQVPASSGGPTSSARYGLAGMRTRRFIHVPRSSVPLLSPTRPAESPRRLRTRCARLARQRGATGQVPPGRASSDARSTRATSPLVAVLPVEHLPLLPWPEPPFLTQPPDRSQS